MIRTFVDIYEIKWKVSQQIVTRAFEICFLSTPHPNFRKEQSRDYDEEISSDEEKQKIKFHFTRKLGRQKFFFFYHKKAGNNSRANRKFSCPFLLSNKREKSFPRNEDILWWRNIKFLCSRMESEECFNRKQNVISERRNSSKLHFELLYWYTTFILYVEY